MFHPVCLIAICIQADDPASGRVPRAAARNPTRKRGTRAYLGYVEESDSASEASWKEASCKDAAHPPVMGTRKVYI
jgi:hypothetical protein